ncbi:LRIG2, partial [Cordylochernes scorpioides]
MCVDSNLSSNILQQFPSLRPLPHLTSLDFYNKLTSFPVFLFPNRTQLQNLVLTGNLIDSLEPSDLANFTNLKTLHLGRNRLFNISKSTFANLSSLVFLDLSRNHLSQLEGLTFGLKSLQVLSLRYNAISQMSDGTYYGLPNLVKLYLDFNNLTSISNGWLYGLTALRHLSLTNNKIAAVDNNDWSLCGNLAVLNLSHNRLTNLTHSSFRSLSYLRRLYLDHNSISAIEEGALAELPSLTVLEMSFNLLPWDHEALVSTPFSGLSRLRRLNLAHNYIHHVSRQALSGISNLRFLDLSHNPIASLQDKAFNGCPQLKGLKMSTSSLLCDCTLRWFHRWLSNSPRFSHQPVLQQTPSSHVVLQGSTANLTCQATSLSVPSSFRWRKDGQPLVQAQTTNTDRVQEDGVILYSTTLLLPNVSTADQGAYQCVISNQLGSAYSSRAIITVHAIIYNQIVLYHFLLLYILMYLCCAVHPYFTKVPNNTLAVRVGGMARLVCAAKGLPAPEVSWRRLEGSTDHFPAAKERRMHVMPSDDVFFIVNVKLSDSGIYSCTASNSAGAVSATVNLSVYEVPTMLNSLENKESRVGESVTLDCRAAGGSPQPAVQWFKDGRPLRLAEDRHYLTAGGHILVIMHVLHSDSGLYLCRMANPLGMDEGSCYLSVLPQRDVSVIIGTVVIVIVLCIVLTSLVWVIIIYRTRRRRRHKALPAAPPLEDSAFLCTDSGS